MFLVYAAARAVAEPMKRAAHDRGRVRVRVLVSGQWSLPCRWPSWSSAEMCWPTTSPFTRCARFETERRLATCSSHLFPPREQAVGKKLGNIFRIIECHDMIHAQYTVVTYNSCTRSTRSGLGVSLGTGVTVDTQAHLVIQTPHYVQHRDTPMQGTPHMQQSAEMSQTK